MTKNQDNEEKEDMPAVIFYDQSSFWKYAALALTVLLAVSVFTNGFGFIKSGLSGLSLGGQENTQPTGMVAQNLEEGQILIEEYSDFECPFCGRAYPTIKQIQEDYGNKIQLVYKHFPLNSIHPNAQKAAEASECARDQGKFWEYHDKLFENQVSLEVSSLKKYAADIGLDTIKFNSCLDSGEKSSVVQQDFNDGQQKGVSGTPTFFINGQQLVGAQPYENFKKVLDAQLSGEAPVLPQAEPEQEPSFLSGSIDDDPVKGNADAKVVLIEWSDFQCPYCGRFYSETLPSIEKNYIETGKLRLVFRDFPLSFHPQATPAAEAAECANEQGKFWEYHDKLFENQGVLSADNYALWADELNLDTEKFTDCVSARKYKDEITSDMSEGEVSGVTGTPGFLLGVMQDDGKTVIGASISGAQPYAVFEQAIELMLAQADLVEGPGNEDEGTEVEVQQPENIKEFNVTASNWEFVPGTINVNLGDKVKLNVISTDVSHGIAIPDFGVSERLEPGELVAIEFTADKTGEFTFFCNVACGSGHKNMKGLLVVS